MANDTTEQLRVAAAAVVEKGSQHKVISGLIISAILGGGICAGVELELRAPGVELHVNQPEGE